MEKLFEVSEAYPVEEGETGVDNYYALKVKFGDVQLTISEEQGELTVRAVGAISDQLLVAPRSSNTITLRVVR
jgi:hypothetical protein